MGPEAKTMTKVWSCEPMALPPRMPLRLLLSQLILALVPRRLLGQVARLSRLEPLLHVGQHRGGRHGQTMSSVDQIGLVELHCDVPVAPLGCSALLVLGLESGDETVQLGVIAAEHRSNARRRRAKGKAALRCKVSVSFSKFASLYYECGMPE